MAKILLAEDDEYLRDTIAGYLNSKGHAVVSVPNGKVAKTVAFTDDFNIIISDVQMPYTNGVEFLQWIREHSKVPFVLMTGFTNLLETQKAAELGANGFLAKPFSNQSLAALVKDLLAPKFVQEEEAHKDKVENEYCKVSIDEFVARPKIEFDLYVKLAKARFLKIANMGETLDVKRIRSYMAKGLLHLHIKKEDFTKLIGFNMQVTKSLNGNSKVDPEKKANFMRYTGEVILEKCFVDKVDRQSLLDAKEFVTNASEAMMNDKNMFDLLSVLNGHSDEVYAQSIGVAMYSVMIAKKMGMQSGQTHFKLSMAGMFHDIGKKEIDREILNKSRSLLTIEERKLIESHAQRGREIMESIPGTSSDVIQIIYEHHEDEIGQGYPRRPTKTSLHPLSKIIYVADQFVSRAMRTTHSPGADAEAAVVLMEKFDSDRLNPEVFAALKSIVNTKRAAA